VGIPGSGAVDPPERASEGGLLLVTLKGASSLDLNLKLNFPTDPRLRNNNSAAQSPVVQMMSMNPGFNNENLKKAEVGRKCMRILHAL
jgi:hypothetical protein